MGDFSGVLSPKQEKAIIALLNEPTIRQASHASGLGETTLYRWLQDSQFKLAYRKARKQTLNQIISHLQNGSEEAVSTLISVMKDKETPHNSRVSAAKAVLDYSFKGIEMEEIISRVEELEDTLSNVQGLRN